MYVDTAYQGLAEPNDKFLAPGHFAYPADVPNPYEYDPDKARELLETAGLVGAQVKLLVGAPSAAPPLGTDIAEVMQQQLDAVGFDTEIVQVENSFSVLGTEDWDIYLGSATLPASMSSFILPGSVGNVCNLDFPEVVDTFQATTDVTLTLDEQIEAWAEFQQGVFDTAAFFNVASQFDLVAYNDEKVTGVPGDISTGYPLSWGRIFVIQG